jgi:hypothetical protein
MPRRMLQYTGSWGFRGLFIATFEHLPHTYRYTNGGVYLSYKPNLSCLVSVFFTRYWEHEGFHIVSAFSATSSEGPSDSLRIELSHCQLTKLYQGIPLSLSSRHDIIPLPNLNLSRAYPSLMQDADPMRESQHCHVLLSVFHHAR